MPIVRWNGWAAKCGACGKLVEIGDSTLAYVKRDHVIDAVRPQEDKILYRTIEEAIRAMCECGRAQR